MLGFLTGWMGRGSLDEGEVDPGREFLDVRCFVFERLLEGGFFQWVAMPLPAVLTIQSGINQLRYATLKGIMAAKKKEIRKVPGAASGATLQRVLRVYLPDKAKKTQMIDGAPAAAAKTLVAHLRDEARVI